MPEIDSGARFRKWVTVLVGIAAATAGVLAFAEAEANRQKEHGLVESARDAQQIFVRLGANTQLLQFSGNATREALAVTLQGAARVRSSKPGQPRAFAIAVAQADKQASARLLAVVKQMGAVPAHTSGLDPRTADAVRSSVASAKALLAKQNAAAEAAAAGPPARSTRSSRSGSWRSPSPSPGWPASWASAGRGGSRRPPARSRSCSRSSGRR